MACKYHKGDRVKCYITPSHILYGIILRYAMNGCYRVLFPNGLTRRVMTRHISFDNVPESEEG